MKVSLVYAAIVDDVDSVVVVDLVVVLAVVVGLVVVVVGLVVVSVVVAMNVSLVYTAVAFLDTESVM